MRNRSRPVVMVFVWGLILIMLIWVLFPLLGISELDQEAGGDLPGHMGALAAISADVGALGF